MPEHASSGLRRHAGTLALLLAGAGILAAPASAGEVDQGRGKAILEAQCARCHAVGTSGDSPRSEAPPFRTLSQRYPVAQLAEALAEGIVTGHNDMPQFVFAPDEIEAIIAYLDAINPPHAK